jgi:hypothetical protein
MPKAATNRSNRDLVHEVIVGEGNDDDIQSIVHLEFMLGKRCFTVNEMPPEAVNLWRVSYLLAEVLNGGLALHFQYGLVTVVALCFASFSLGGGVATLGCR